MPVLRLQLAHLSVLSLDKDLRGGSEATSLRVLAEEDDAKVPNGD